MIEHRILGIRYNVDYNDSPHPIRTFSELMPQFVKDTGTTALTRMLTRVFGLLSTVLLARFLGPSGNGYYTLALLFASTTVALMNFGLSSTTIYYLARGKYNREEVLGHLFLFNIFVTALALSVGWIIVIYFKDWLFPQTPRTYLLLGIWIIPGSFFYRFFRSALLGLQRFDLYNFGQVFWAVARLLLLALAFFLFDAKISGAILAEATSWMLGALLFFHWTKSAVPRWSFHFNIPLIQEMLVYGFQSYLGNLLAFFNYRSNLFLINFFLGPSAVGIYSIAVGLAERLWLISQTASTVLLPRVSAATDPEWRRRFTPLITRTVFIMVFPAAILLGFFARPLIVLLYSEAFLEAAQPLQILLIGIVTFSLSRVLAQDIAGRGYPLLNTYTSALALAVNIGLNLLLIPLWGIKGAAWASAVSYTALFISKLMLYGRLSGNSWGDVIWSKRNDWALYYETAKKIISWIYRSYPSSTEKDQ